MAQTVRRSIDAENAGDVAAFLGLWSDDGLAAYDAGTRADIESGRAPLGGGERTEVRGFEGTTVKGDEASTTAVVAVGIGLYRMRFDFTRDGDRWQISDWQFLGPAPPAEGTPVVPVRAVDFAYDVDPAALVSGGFALHFVNDGKEAHEISLVTIPPGVTKAEAVFALGSVRGIDFGGLPAGYAAVGHLAFAEPGQNGTYSLARTLAPGRYAMACFLPVGGLDPFGAATTPDAPTHVAQGMLTEFSVA